MKDNKFVIEFKNVSKSFVDGKFELKVLDNINFNLSSGEHIAIVGKSGSGKSTFLQLMGGLDYPSSGDVLLDGENFSDMSDEDIDRARNTKLGFVYQFHHLLPEFSVAENVMLPLIAGGYSSKESYARALSVLKMVDLEDRNKYLPGKLSGGEKQRVAIARAIVCKPRCIFADEPTGNLDPETGEKVINLIRQVNPETAIVVVTHDMTLAKKFDKIYRLTDGKFEEL